MISEESNNTQKLLSSKNNLIQNFYIIGFSLEDFLKINKEENKVEFLDIFGEKSFDELNITPKIITKFPNEKMCLNSIPDNIIIQHCFPNDVIKLTKDNKNHFFQFNFDNVPQNFENCYRKIYSKIYFTCLEIKEPLLNYLKYKNELINLISENKSLELSDKDKCYKLTKDDETKCSEIFISKILCFSSVLPFYNELTILLDSIYNYYLSTKNFALLSLEKVIEKIISNTYIPLIPGEELSINFKTENYKNTVIFSQNIMSEINVDFSANMSLIPFFKYFSPEEIVNIFRYILYEIPILFFCSDKSICSLFVNVFLTLISPFKYVFPHISILPKKLYGIIGSEKRFFFGINETYNESFFEDNGIELNKTLIIISLDNTKNPPTTKIEEKIYDNNNKDKIYIITNRMSKPIEDIILINSIQTSILNIDLPNSFKKKLIERINKCSSLLNKKSNKKKDSPYIDISFNIKNSFFKFFVEIFEGYTDYLIRSKYLYNETFTKNENIGENIFFKSNDKFKKEVFNEDEFIAKSQKDYFAFYKIFLKTEMFTYFLRERIYNQDAMTQLAIKQFDQLTFLSKHSDMRKKKENKAFFENYKNDKFENIKIEKKNEILIKEETTLDKNDFEEFMKNKNNSMNILINFGQLFAFKKIKEPFSRENLIDLKYFIFPKLNFEYLYRNNLNLNQLYSINDSYIINYNKICQQLIGDYINKRPYAFYTSFFNKLKETNISCINYEVIAKNYIDYIWLLLLTASLWYCEEDEKKYRLDKMLFALNNYEVMEEYVLNFIFINIYKSSSAFYLIKFFIIYYKIVGKIDYYLLNLLCDKIQNNSDENESEGSLKNNIEGKRELYFSKRYLISPENDFNFNNEEQNDENDGETKIYENYEDTDQLIFCSEQKCEKCNKICDIDATKFIEFQTELIEEWPKYKCPICKQFYDIKINYQILKVNYINNEIVLIESGEFKFLTPFKLYQEIKSFFIKENTTKLDINNIFSFSNKIHLYNVIFYFSLANINYDFLFPYEAKFRSNLKNIFNNLEKEKAKNDKKLIKLTFKNNKNNFRRFNNDNIQPLLNEKIKSSKILGIFKRKDKYIESDLSFTIKNSKNKTTKKNK